MNINGIEYDADPVRLYETGGREMEVTHAALCSSGSGKPYCDCGAEVRALREELAACQGDAERLRWLTEDHPEPETRERVRSICESIQVRSLSGTRLDIDAARKGEENLVSVY